MKCDRRKFLQLALLSSGSFLGSCLSHSGDRSRLKTKIIVVGAGIAGLTAAQALQSQGADVIVVEAKPYVGGRLLTDYSLGTAFEIGAGWIHGPDGNPISTLAKQIQGKTFVTEDDSLLVYDHNGNAISEAVIDKLDERFDSLLKQVDNYVGTDDFISLQEAILKVNPTSLEDPLINWALTAFTEFDTGGPIEKLSAGYFNEDEAFDGDDIILVDGYDSILTPLSQGLDIRLNTIVTAIKYSNEEIRVATNTEELLGDYVICTVPLGVLQAGKIAFSPVLPESHQQSINKIPMGNVTKVALKFPQAFWPLNTQYFGFQSEVKGKWPYFMNYRMFSNQNILVALSFGSYPSKIESESDQVIQGEIMDILRIMFGNAISEPKQIIVTRWSQDPHTWGAYSFAGTKTTPQDFEVLAKPVANRLFFAGEHTNFDYHGTTHGAYLSGVAAAEKIIVLCQDDSLE